MMNSSEIVIFLLQISAMLAAALISGRMARRFHCPTVFGELAGGVILGPTVLGTLFPAMHGTLFPGQGAVAVSREAVLQLGMLFFLFIAGLEVDLDHLKTRGTSAFWTSVLGMAVPFSLGIFFVRSNPAFWAAHLHGSGWTPALFFGTALSITALPVIARVLKDLNLLKTDFGTVVMTAATVDDLAGWSLFSVLLSQVHSGNGGGSRPFGVTLLWTCVFIGAVLVCRHWVKRGILQAASARVKSLTGLTMLTFVLVLLSAACTEAIGIHAVFGAFLAGVALARSSERWDEAHQTISRFVMSFFVPVYFVSIGLRVNFTTHFDARLTGIVLAVAFLGKVLGASFGAALGRVSLREAVATGFAMNARGAMEIVLATLAFNNHLIDEPLFVSLIFMALVTSLVSGPVIKRLLRV